MFALGTVMLSPLKPEIGIGTNRAIPIELDDSYNLTVLEDMCLGHTVADVMVILGSIDIVMGEVDR